MAGPERAARIALLVPAGLLIAVMIESWPVTVDDAFITLRHARHWIETGNPSFDRSERIEAYSSFSAVALDAAVLGAGGDPIAAAKALGAACALGALALTVLLARGTGAGPLAALLGALILSVTVGMGFWAVSGMETALFTLLLSSGVFLLLGDGSGSRWPACGVLLLAALTRVEGPLLVAAAITARAFVRAGEGRRVSEIAREHAWVVALAGGYAAYFAWRWQYYGHFLPSPIYFKRIGAAHEAWESHSAAFVRGSFPLLLLAAAAPWVHRRAAIPVAVVAAALAVFSGAREQVLEDVSTMAWFDRYFVPVLPCLVAAAMVSLHAAARRAETSPRRAGVALASAFLLVWPLVNPEANPIRLLARTRAYPQVVAARNVPAADYLQKRVGPAGRVIAGDIGLLGARFRGTLWDLYGLASYDRTLRHGGALEPYLRELLERAPDAIVLCFSAASDPPRPCQHAERVLAEQAEFRAHYAPAAEFGRREAPSAYHVVFVRRAP